jgi:hypothetical protein
MPEMKATNPKGIPVAEGQVRCQECGEQTKKRNAFIAKIQNKKTVLCASCTIKLNPEKVMTYYYNRPYCPECKTKATGPEKICLNCGTELPA